MPGLFREGYADTDSLIIIYACPNLHHETRKTIFLLVFLEISLLSFSLFFKFKAHSAIHIIFIGAFRQKKCSRTQEKNIQKNKRATNQQISKRDGYH